MNVMDLVAKISLDSNEYEKGVGNAKTSFSNLGSSIASGAKSIAKVGVAAFAAVGTAIGGATTALINNASETAAYADNIDKMSQKMGFTAEKFQEWDFIMQHNGSSIEAVKGAMLKLDKSLESGSEAYDRLGLSQEALINMSADEKFEAVVTALQGVTDETEKAALAEEVFGKSYQEMMPLLNSTVEETEAMKKEVHDLGGVMSDEAVKAGAQFQDSLQNLKTALTGAKNNLMGEFLPSLTTVMDGLSSLFSGDESGIGQIKQGIEDFAQKLNDKLPTVLQTAGSILTSLVSALPSAFEAISSQLPSILDQAIPVLIDAVVGLADSVVSALPSMMSAIEKNIGKITSGLSKVVSAIGQIILKLTPTLLPMLLRVGIQLVTELAKGFSENASEVMKTIVDLINMIVVELTNPDTLIQLLDCGIQILTAVVNGIAENMPLLLETAGILISNLIDFLVQAIPDLVVAIGKNGATIVTDVLPNLLTSIGLAVADILQSIGKWIGEGVYDLQKKAEEFFQGIPNALSELWTSFKDGISKFAGDAIAWFGEKFAEIKDVGKNLVEGLWNGINNAKDWVIEKIKGFGEDILSGIKSFFGIASPAKTTKLFGKYIAQGLAVGVEEEADNTFRDIQTTLDNGMESLDLDPLDLNTNANVAVRSTKTAAESKMDQLLEMMNEIINNREEMTIPIFVGGRQIDEVFIDSKNRVTVRSGGQVNV